MPLGALAAQDSGLKENEEVEESSNDQQDFIDKETRMLLLPDDDVVLGELTYDAMIEHMDSKLFIKEFLANHDYWSRENARQETDNFIKNYNRFKNNSGK
jgi:hypothetical protein